jgi:hypothetical protein
MYARRKEEVETPAQMRRSVTARVVRCVKACEALVADGSVRSVGRATVLSV